MAPLTFLCIATFFKGEAFLKACKESGNTVLLLTDQKLADKPWPDDAIDERFYLIDPDNSVEKLNEMIEGLAFMMRQRNIDRVVALDDFDVEKAALIRETFRLPGMGQTTARYFRDKLAMRMRAAEAGITVPAFCALFTDAVIRQFLAATPGPWLVKPRSEASATGIRQVHTPDEAWSVLEQLGQQRHDYLMECFQAGDVYHVDSLSVDGQVVFTQASQYLATPLSVAHQGGVFRTMTLSPESPQSQLLTNLNAQVLRAFGMVNSASHAEYIQCDDGQVYFLETSSRVAGAHIPEMIEAATGINLWREWALLENAVARQQSYQLPNVATDSAGLIVSLARQQWPDLTVFNEPEVCWRMEREYHIGLAVRAKKPQRVQALLTTYMERIFSDFHASAPLPDKPID